MKAFGIAAVVIVVVVAASMIPVSGKEQLVGGVSGGEDHPANDEVKGYINQLSADIKASDAVKNSGADANAAIETISFKTQVVSGTNFFVKVRIADKHFLLRIYRDFSKKVKLVNAKAIQESDKIGYF